MISNYDMIFKNKLTHHLTHYYVKTLGLGDIENRIYYREHEEIIEEARIKNLFCKLDWDMSEANTKKMLVVGSGWGGMLYAAKKLGIDVCGIDVDKDEIEISKLRFLKDGLTPALVYLAPAENLPFRDETFDLVYCFSVVEHVQNVEKTISEIARVMKQGAYGYIQTQNYNIPWEPHFKMVLPTMFGYRISKFILRLRGRVPDYLDTVNLIRKGEFLNMLSQYGIPQVEEWDIVRDTIAKNGGIEVGFSKEKKKDPLRYFKNFDMYLGALVFEIYRLLGMTNVMAIVKKV